MIFSLSAFLLHNKSYAQDTFSAAPSKLGMSASNKFCIAIFFHDIACQNP